MKRLILTGLAGLAMLSTALGRTDLAYTNDVVSIYNPFNPPPMDSPPVVDATAFINNSTFVDQVFSPNMPYATANTVNYTNYGLLNASTGFRFDTFNTHATTPFYTNAGTLFNAPGAIINCGGTDNGSYGYAAFSKSRSLCLALATNIINRGTIEVGLDGVMSLQGQNVNLFGGLLNMQGFESTTAGMFPGYWGLGLTPEYNPATSFGSIQQIAYAFSPFHWVTNRNYTFMETELNLAPATNYFITFTNPVTASTTNAADPFTIIQTVVGVTYRLVYLQNGDSTNITHNVYFQPLPLLTNTAVEWAWPSTNIITGVAQTNHLYLVDNLLGLSDNLTLVPNGSAPPSTGNPPLSTFIPTNYWLGGSVPFTLPARATNRFTGTIGPNTNITAAYTAYEAFFQPTTRLLSDVSGRAYTNMPGRIEVTASKQLDLRSSRISGLNYLRLTATNNFSQDPNLRISTAVADYNLAVTNSTLTVSNLLSPTVPRLNGYVDVFSTCWTNIYDFPGTTNISGTNIIITLYSNSYFVTLVDSHLSSSSPATIQNLNLHATNVVISDVLNILSNITIDAYSMTVTTNGGGAQTLAGQLNLPINIPIVASTFPRLRTLTNSGLINAANSATFGAPSTPLWNFVNRGRLLADGCSIWANNVENTGLITAGAGAIKLTATSAVLRNGVLNAVNNNIVLNSGSLFISNQVLNAGRSLTIQVANSLNDGGPVNGNRNNWAVGTLGFNLPVKPTTANLLGTTITSIIPAYDYFVECQWAGDDLGPVVAGYTNNAALGRLILSGTYPSSFLFAAPTGNNALYVDYLEFRNSMTNFDAATNLANLYFGPGMKIYYAQLVINGVSWAERLNGKNDGALVWVPTYAGAFSSTNLVYSDGTTNRLNTALVQSCTIDSNGNGVPNCSDTNPIPVLSPASLALRLVFTNIPPGAVELSWNSVPYSTNYVYFKPSATVTNWQLLTTNSFLPRNPFVLGPAGGRQRILDPVNVGGLYRVRVDAAAP